MIETEPLEQPLFYNEDDTCMTVVFKLSDRKKLDALYDAFKAREEFAIGRPFVLSWGDLSRSMDTAEHYIECLENEMTSDDIERARQSFKKGKQ